MWNINQTEGVYKMKLIGNHHLLEINGNRQLYRADPALYERIMGGWAALPATIRGQVCEALKFSYPLRAWGNEKGFGFWTMNRMGARIAFHVGDPSPCPNMLLTVKICDEVDREKCYWNHSQTNLQNHRNLRELVVRIAFETMAHSGPKHREWIHSLINEIYPL